ncbi:uncharacterized protein F5891DRAFT_750966 [Suillus fuscotomentosus]|uniref:Uncharacterized protein n=1 Tax=Suillus fuscotomentosus TaxID=1912939 RepID=A0AAD4EEG0_9AGAM|nr:uncharacterized protein F5891DRAFT_750966 [Suillus fuscotomentosus]KAG1904610.1 hypothetical protein F5891DRAFT_750966 [Suillus fuscotomentosus]
MRLPSYRSSHMLRYHPYPRVGLSQREMLTHTIEESGPLLQINNPLSGHNIEYEDTSNALDLPGNEEQVENAPNPPEVVEVPEQVFFYSHLLTHVVSKVILLFVVRKLAVIAQ